MSPPLSAHRPLPPGYILDVYQFERVLGKAGAFGITYRARNLSGREQVAIKELFPSDYAIRDPTGHVVVQTVSDEKTFTEAIRMFRREAEILSRVRHDNVVRVLDYLEANGTGYMVMQYEDGYDLRTHLETQRPYRPNDWIFEGLLFQNPEHRLWWKNVTTGIFFVAGQTQCDDCRNFLAKSFPGNADRGNALNLASPFATFTNL